jgi:polysaccharide biosynthesis/export protein
MKRLLSIIALLLISVLPAVSQTVHLSQPLRPAPLAGNAQETVSKSEAPVKVLKPFGYELFQNSSAELNNVNTGAMTRDYLLGAGDQLAIHLGGKVQENFETMVSADGQVYIPTLGVLSVQNLTFNQFKERLHEKLQRLYSHYTLDVMLVTPKFIRIGVTGEVQVPGQYTITALSSVLDAVSQAKGPTEIGSLRDIQVFRGDSLVLRADLYDYLLQAGAGVYGQLQSGDQIFVPVCRQRVLVKGEVYRPAIYEINPNRPETLTRMLELAGGLTDYSLTEKIEHSCMDDSGRRRVHYYSLSEISRAPGTDPFLHNDDQIQVFSKLDQTPKNIVAIYGEVNHPGEYEFEKNVRISDLILKAGYLTRSAYLLKAQVAKVDPIAAAKTIDVDLTALLVRHDPQQDLLLDADDQVFIRRIPGWQVGPKVEVRGEARFPGYYPIVKDSTTLKMILTQAGGFTREALSGEAKLLRKREAVVVDKEFDRLKTMTRDDMSKLEYEYLVMKQNSADVQEVVVDFDKLMNGHDRSQDVLLQADDVIYIPETPKVVLISGRVGKPGGVVFKENEKLSYYIDLAGGYTWDADGRRTKVIKVTGEILDDEDVDRFVPGDRVWVPRKADHDYWQIFRDVMLVAGQVATMYLVIHTVTK